MSEHSADRAHGSQSICSDTGTFIYSKPKHMLGFEQINQAAWVSLIRRLF
jgi:hypothetical protein